MPAHREAVLAVSRTAAPAGASSGTAQIHASPRRAAVWLWLPALVFPCHFPLIVLLVLSGTAAGVTPVLGKGLGLILVAQEISRRSYRKILQNVALAFCFTGIGIPLAATGLVYPVWTMAAMAVSVTAIFLNSLWGRPGLFIDAVLGVGRPVAPASPQAI